MTAGDDRTERRRRLGARARADGHAAEVLAALWLMVKGYRVIAFRQRLQGVEIDLAARRGSILAVVEVKRRATLEAALGAVAPAQQARLQRAGQALADRMRGPGGAPPSVRLDLMALAPRSLPRHVPDAWRGAPGEQTAHPWS